MKQTEVGGGRGSGPTIKSRYIQIGTGSNTRRPPPHSPCGLTEDKWTGEARWHRRKKGSCENTEKLVVTLPAVLILIVVLHVARNARNYNKEETELEEEKKNQMDP